MLHYGKNVSLYIVRDTLPPTWSAHLSAVWRGSDEDCTARHCADVEVMLVLVPDLWSLSHVSNLQL